MKVTEAELELLRWKDEFEHIHRSQAPKHSGWFAWFQRPEPPVASPGFLRFAAMRMTELVQRLLPEDKRADWNVVRANINGTMRQIRVGGRRAGHITCEYGEPGTHGIGIGIVSIADVAEDDRSKLARILDKIEGVTPGVPCSMPKRAH